MIHPLEPLLTAWILLAWGAHAVANGRAPGAPPEGRRLWRLAALPLLVTGAWCAAAILSGHPDEALAEGFGDIRASHLATIVVILFAAQALAAILAWAAGETLEPAGWRILAGLGAVFLFATSLASEMMRMGESRGGRFGIVLLLAACRFLVALAAGETVSPGRPRLAILAAPALLLYCLLLPSAVVTTLLHHQQWAPFLAAALLFALARWLPQRLRRPALFAATLLAGVALTIAAALTHLLGPIPAS